MYKLRDIILERSSNPKALILAGSPGAGKSSFIEDVDNTLILNVDDYYNASTTSDSWLLQKLDEYNVKTEERGDFFKMGVIDPLKVTKTAFENAVSVATTILTTNAIITHARVKE